MAQGRIMVDRALLITKIETLQKKEVAEYEKEMKAYEKAYASHKAKLQQFAKKIATALSKHEVANLHVSDDYEWDNGTRVIRGVDVRFDLRGILLSEFGTIPSLPNKPRDPREERHGKYLERAKMLEMIGLTTKTEVSLPLRWSEDYL